MWRRILSMGWALVVGITLGVLAESVSAEVPTEVQRRCINEMNKSLRKVAKDEGRNILYCLRNAAKGRTGNLGAGGTVSSCLTTDFRNKVARRTHFRNAIVTNEWVGKRENLSKIGWIRDSFTVTHQTCSKYEFTTG